MTFEAFRERATADAVNAKIPGFKSVPGLNIRSLRKRHEQIVPIRFEKIDTPFVRGIFDGPFYAALTDRKDIPTVSAVFAADINGNTIPPSQEPRDLGAGETDFFFIYEGAGISKVLADGVMMGGNTIRGANKIFSFWHPESVRYRESIGKPRHPTQIVATRSGDLDIEDSLLFNAPQVPVFILTTRSGAEKLKKKTAGRKWIKIISMGKESDLRSGLRILKRGFGMEMITAIGGQELVNQMFDQGLVRNLYLTKSPIVAGLPGTGLKENIPKVLALEKRGQGPEAGVIFQHFVIRQ